MNRYNRLKKLSKFNLPTGNYKYQDYVWMYRGKKVLLADMSTFDLSKCLSKTKNANWNDIYEGHYRTDWIKAFSAELTYRSKVQKWSNNKLEISILKETNNK